MYGLDSLFYVVRLCGVMLWMWVSVYSVLFWWIIVVCFGLVIDFCGVGCVVVLLLFEGCIMVVVL